MIHTLTIGPALAFGIQFCAPLPVAAPLYSLADEINDQAAAAVALAPELAEPSRDKIEAMHDLIEAGPDGAIETLHYFADGLYGREIHVPAGTWVVGAIHGESHINVLSKGDVSVATEAGSRRIQAPATFEAVAGRKVVGFAHTDTVWTTFHANPTNERDPDKLFDLLTVAEYPNVIDLIGSEG